MTGKTMSDSAKRAICVGEATIELARGGDGRFALASSGDAFNTAIYLARAGQPTAFATALGDDPYSDAIVSLAAAEGIGTDLITRVAGRLPALALVDANLKGERRAHVWRDTAPARDLFELPTWSLTAAALTSARLIYFSGITLSLYSNVGLGRFLAALELSRSAGATIAFDGNFRADGWRGDLARARTVFAEALKRVDIALPAYDDEAVLWGDPSPEATVERLQAFGVTEIVVKNGPNGALVAGSGGRDMVPVPEIVTPVDATAAGDGFNAGYLAARLAGRSALDAAAAAHRLAGQVIRHRGAIVPRTGAAVH
jgi:2-dehydro-3-deoxygluconokinase